MALRNPALVPDVLPHRARNFFLARVRIANLQFASCPPYKTFGQISCGGRRSGANFSALQKRDRRESAFAGAPSSSSFTQAAAAVLPPVDQDKRGE
jgi:hypothetical protein